MGHESWADVIEPDDAMPPEFEGFDIVLRGYDRAQVDAYLTRVEDDLATAMAERDHAVINLKSVSAQLDRAYRDLRDSHRKMSEIRNQIGLGPDEPGPIQEQLAGATKQLAAAEQKLKAGAGDLAELRARLQVAENDVKTLGAESERLRHELDRARQRAAEDTAPGELQHTRIELDRTRTELASVRAQLTAAQDKLLESGSDRKSTR